ncbi:MAG TPA: acyl carrier protein [Candidatus Gemmiger stercorigallinarum]|nr:acyl carrier protein [Candidatus Gemmiger stercorigallinarum]
MDFETLKQVIVDTLSCDEDKVTMEATLAEDLGADSLDAVELNMAIEESCGVAIPDEELGNMKTVGDIFNYLQAHAE